VCRVGRIGAKWKLEGKRREKIVIFVFRMNSNPSCEPPTRTSFLARRMLQKSKEPNTQRPTTPNAEEGMIIFSYLCITTVVSLLYLIIQRQKLTTSPHEPLSLDDYGHVD
jgi:hypothetical protein